MDKNGAKKAKSRKRNGQKWEKLARMAKNRQNGQRWENNTESVTESLPECVTEATGQMPLFALAESQWCASYAFLTLALVK